MVEWNQFFAINGLTRQIPEKLKANRVQYTVNKQQAPSQSTNANNRRANNNRRDFASQHGVLGWTQ
jgi:hypothetical protein